MLEICIDPHIMSKTQLKNRESVANLRMVFDTIERARTPVQIIVTDNLKLSYRSHFAKWSEIPQSSATKSLELFIQNKLMGKGASVRECPATGMPPCNGCADICTGIESPNPQYLIESEIGCDKYPSNNFANKTTVDLFGESKLYEILSTENIQELISHRISDTTWMRLTNESRLFLETSLVTWQHFQALENYDFLSVCAPLSKMIEVELCRIVDVFLTQTDAKEALKNIIIEDREKQQISHKLLLHSQNEHTRVSLGAFPYMFKDRQKNMDLLEIAWWKYVNTLRNATFLLSDFFHKSLFKLTASRNPGTHRIPVHRTDCMNFMNTILGESAQTPSGLLSRILDR